MTQEYLTQVQIAKSILDELAASANGVMIDRMAPGLQGYLQGVLFAATGDAEGTPTSFTVDVKLQHGDASDGTGAADVVGETLTQIIAIDTVVQKQVDLSKLKRYVRAVATIAFVGGTSPNIALFAGLALGQPSRSV